jgi:glycosyltransferase involved in cell wall biosynthesis
MKILWLTNSPAGASTYVDQNTPGRGWIASLGDVIKSLDDVNLAVCFFNNKIEEFKFSHEGITYYPIKDKLATKLRKIHSKAFGTLWDSNLPDLLKVVEDYKPEIIQLFGTETGLGEIVGKIRIPIIIHIQGLVNPYVCNWFPLGFSPARILVNSSLKDLIMRRDLYSDYLFLKKIARREQHIIKHAKYFFGRTTWDRRVVNLFNDRSQYFYCNEVLRPFIYDAQWSFADRTTLKLVTTINPQIYKGLDIVLETAQLLRRQSKKSFEWNIIGIESDHKVVKMIERCKRAKFRSNSVYFRGVKHGRDLVSQLLESDIFIHPSHIDNSPNSICEAMLLGMPVVAGNVGGVSSIVESGHSGVCYNSRDAHELAAIILEKSLDQRELQRLGRNAREVALERHDRSKIASQVLETYRLILSQEKNGIGLL